MSFNPFAQFTTGPANNAFNDFSGYLQNGLNQALPQYQTGIQNLQQYSQQALAPLQQNAATANVGTQGLLNLLGLGGQAGTQGALRALEGTPGFQFAKQQGDNAIAAQAQRGGNTGGHEALDLAKFNQGLAGTTYQNAVNNYQPFLNLASNTAGQTANTNLGFGSALNSAFGNIGNAYWGTGATLGQAAAARDLSQYGASTNQFNALAGIGGGIAGSPLGSSLFSGLGGALGSIGGLFTGSDVKLKEDIEPVGALASGETVYRYRYKGDPRTQIGLIAQEVEGSTPDAVVEFLPDLRAVDYHRATERAAKILEFSRERHEPPPTLRPYASELLELAA